MDTTAIPYSRMRRSILLTPFSLLAAPANPLPIRVGKRLVTNLYHSGYPKPFLYPILAPDGTELSRGWPVQPRPEDKQDHPWHRGIWWGHGDINGHDFWREQKGTATIRVDNVLPAKSPAVTLDQSLVPASGKSLGRLTTHFRFAIEPEVTTIDASIMLIPAEPVRFGDTEDGGFAFRLREEFREDRGATLLNSDGKRGATAIWGKPAAWTDYSSRVNNKPYGVAIFAHPSNLRHPSGWHARNYGLNSANPFAASGFAEEKNGQRGALQLKKNEPLRLRYQVVIHNGDANQARIAARYEKYIKESR